MQVNEMELGKKDQEITRLSTEVKKLKSTVSKLQQENKTLKTSLESARVENATLKKKIAQSEPENKVAKSDAEPVDDIEVVDEIDGDASDIIPEVTDVVIRKPRILAVIDSNRKEIIPHLDLRAAEWTILSTINRAKELREFAAKATERKFCIYDCVVIMVGTADIVKGVKGLDVLEMTEEAAAAVEREATDTIAVCVEIPPLTNAEYNFERTEHNTMLNTSHRIITSSEYTQYSVDAILQEDGIHLTSEGGRITAEAINEYIAENIQGKSEPVTTPAAKNSGLNNVTSNVQIPFGFEKLINGNGGETRKALESDYNVEILVTPISNNPSMKTCKISGSAVNVKLAQKDITRLFEEHKQKDRDREMKKEEKKNTLCKFYGRGDCRFGDKCRFSHDAPPASNVKSFRSRSPARRPASRRGNRHSFSRY